MAEVIKIQYDTEEAVRKVQQLTDAIAANKARQVELKDQLKKNEISQKDYAVQMAETTQTVARDNQEVKKYVNVLESEVGSIKRAKAENQVLREERNKLGDATGKNAAKVAEYNKKIDANTDIINGNIDKHSKLHNTLGKMEGGLNAAAGGFMSMVKGALAFIATPIGAVIALVVGGLTLLKKAFMGTEENQNKVNKATEILSAIFNTLLSVLRPIAEFLVDKIGAGFVFLGNVADKAIGIISKGLKILGFDKAAESVAKFNEQVKINIKLAKEMADAEAKLKEQQREANTIMLEYQRKAEKLRQIRDDESKGIAERIKANEQLGKVLKEQAEAELKIARLQLSVADQRIKIEGKSEENLNKRSEAINKIADIQERITGQESEQLSNLNGLRREQDALLKEELKVKADLAKQTEDEYQKSLDADAAFIEAQGKEAEEEAKRQTEKETKEFEARGRKIVAEAEMLAKLAEMNKAAHEKMLQDAFESMQKIITATGNMGNARVNIISDSFSKIATINFKEVKTQTEGFIAVGQAATVLTNLINANHQNELDDLEAQKQQELALNIDNVTAQAEINKRYAKKAAELKRRQANEDKAKALIDISIATAIGVAKALPNLILAGIVGGLGLVQFGIVAAKPIPDFTSGDTYAKGGIIGGKSHSDGGTKFFGTDGSMFEAERGEAMFVLKKDATAEIAALSMINEAKGGRSFFQGAGSHLADGGEVNGSSMANMINEAIARTPIIVKVGDIETGLTEMNNVKQAGVI